VRPLRRIRGTSLAGCTTSVGPTIRQPTPAPEYVLRNRRRDVHDTTKEHDMRSTEIHKLVEEGILLVAPVRVRSVADIPRVRAALAAPRR
jgi:hypothetical protein